MSVPEGLSLIYRTEPGVINPAVGCHYFPPGLQLPSQPLRGLLPIRCLVNRGMMGVNSLPKTNQTASRLRFVPGPFCA